MADTKRGRVFPWEPDYTNDINKVVNQVEDAVNTVLPGVLPTVLPPVGPPPSPPPVPTPSPSPAAPVIPQGNVTDILGAFENAAQSAAAKAWPQVESQLKSDFGDYMQAYLKSALTGDTTPPVPDVTFDGQSLTKSAAKGHAWRTFLIGMGTSAATAVLSAVAGQQHIDFFSKSGWIATGSIAIGTVVQTAASYITRLRVTPGFEKQLIEAPPELAIQLKK